MKLLFVYNANAGIAAGIMDSIHKVLSPSTYACGLCAITYGALRMDPKWKAWLAAQSFEGLFFHGPDFRAAYPSAATELPAILIDDGTKLVPVVEAKEFVAIPDVDALIALVETRLSQTACVPPRTR